MTIHPTAIIDATAQIGNDVEIGPYAIVGPHCQVGDGARLFPHAVLQEYVQLGARCQVHSGAVLGGVPQDLKFAGETSYVRIGEGSVIRECVTISRASGADEATTVGRDCMLMAYAHLGHNCQVGDEVVIANNAQLAGYIEVGDYAFISGTTAFHQFIKIGKLAMVGGFSGSRQDIPPFSMNYGRPSEVLGINKVGLRRRGADLNTRTRLKRAFQLLWFSNLNMHQGIEAVQAELGSDPYMDELLTFVVNAKRGIRRSSRAMADEEAGGAADHLVEML